MTLKRVKLLWLFPSSTNLNTTNVNTTATKIFTFLAVTQFLVNLFLFISSYFLFVSSKSFRTWRVSCMHRILHFFITIPSIIFPRTYYSSCLFNIFECCQNSILFAVFFLLLSICGSELFRHSWNDIYEEEKNWFGSKML